MCNAEVRHEVNCGECAEKLDGFVDRELSESEVEAVRIHLERCPPCADHYRFQSSLKRLVHVCCCQESAPPAFREKLRQILF